MINVSFIKLKGKVIDNYTKTLKGYSNKMVTWEDIHKPMSSSKVQYSPYAWKNGVKHGKNFDRSKQNCIVLDYDDGTTISSMQKQLKKYQYIITTTKSNMLEKHGLICERFRILIPAINISLHDETYFKALELMFPLSDKQVLIKTASFLGNDNCIVIRNHGKAIDMFKANELAEKITKEENIAKIVIPKDLMNCYGNSLAKMKEALNPEIIQDVLESIGVEFSNGKCKLRPEERSHSAKIYPSGMIIDYGGNIKSDIFGVLQELEGMSFMEAKAYVGNFI